MKTRRRVDPSKFPYWYISKGHSPFTQSSCEHTCRSKKRPVFFTKCVFICLQGEGRTSTKHMQRRESRDQYRVKLFKSNKGFWESNDERKENKMRSFSCLIKRRRAEFIKRGLKRISIHPRSVPARRIG